jgi:glutaredoxin 3
LKKNSPHLALYYFDWCPFCQLVLHAIKSLNLDVDFRDITAEQAHLDQLLADTGRRTVPCLYIDGKPMHESGDIVRWLKQNENQLKKLSP